jgi:large subunit ribosomal protein L9
MSSQKLILLEDIENLGLAGDQISVAPGYARNYLLPKKLAMKSSPGVLRVIEARRGKIEARRQKEIEEAQVIADKLKDVKITIAMEASEDGTLYGSVNERIISDMLVEKELDIPHNKINMDEHIKRVGEFEVSVKLHQKLTATLKVEVVGS